MEITTFHELYVDSLRDLYSAESQLVEALPKVANAVESRELKAALEAHLGQTKEHVARLEEIFSSLNEDPEGHTCAAMKGLIKEVDELIGEIEDKSVLDAAVIGGCQKIEHYEMAGYGTARTFAQLMGHTKHQATLQQTLDEEGAADSKLTDLAETVVNPKANEKGGNESSTNDLAGAGSTRRN